MSANRKRILVALDGSSHALDTVLYLSKVTSPGGVEFVLFSILPSEPDWFSDAIYPQTELVSSIGPEWRGRRKSTVEEFMNDASRILNQKGFPAEAITIRMKEKEIGVARDIILEALNGYDAVVFGRQGTNPITRLVIGSVASKLIQNLTRIPLWIVGETNNSNKILVALDGSEGSMRAVEHVGAIVANLEVHLTLLLVIRSPEEKVVGKGAELRRAVVERPLLDARVEGAAVHTIFEKAYKLLENKGIGRERITTKTISGVATRSGTIVVQAISGGYGTIVLGRRGNSLVGEFHMGRVTNKVIQLAKKMAVWVVN
jgi:nucleotide-binding universal stress UspA family protein